LSLAERNDDNIGLDVLTSTTTVNIICYAYGQRITMKKNGEVYYLYGDQLGSVSAVADADGNQISKTLYHPWGTTRHTQGTSPTDYAYTGQMKEGDIYFYNARWYDPQLGRFMQADTFVPTSQGTQGFDRFAYVNNNPINSSDPSGHCITCVVLAGMAIGTLVDYGIQVYQNTQTGISFQEALTTDISITEIAKGAVIGGSVALIGAGVASLIGTAAVTTTAITASSVACADGDCTNEGTAVVNSVSDVYGNLSHAAEYGIKTYNELRAFTKGTGLQVHHLIEERLADALELTKLQLKNIPSVVVTPTQHQVITNQWRTVIGYVNSHAPVTTVTATYQDIYSAVEKVYRDYPELLRQSRIFLEQIK